MIDLRYFVFVPFFFVVCLLVVSFIDTQTTNRKKELAEIYINSEKYDIYKKCYEVDDIFYCERTDIDV